MLSDKLHAGANSKAFKALLALILLSFILTGVSSYLIPRLKTDPVTIGDYKISSNEWTQQYNQRAQQLHRLGPQASALLENPAYVNQLKMQVLEDMINNVAFNSAVWDLNVRIGDEQVRDVIRNTPAFQKDGRFDNDLYLATVRNMGMSPEYFGEQLRVSLMSKSVSQPILAVSSYPMPYETKALANLITQNRVVDLYTLDTKDLEKNLQVSEDEIKAYYNGHPKEFMAPASVRFNYILLSLDDLKKEVPVNDDKIQEYFDLYHDDFKLPEQRQFSQILIKNDDKDSKKKIAAVEKAIEDAQKAGKDIDFADLAKKYSDDANSKDKGGDMGLVAKGRLASNLDDAVFSLLQVGDLSPKIEDSFGTHFIMLTKIVPPKAAELKDVKDKVREAYVNAKARDLYNERVTTLSDMSFENPDSLDATAEALKVKIKDSGLLDQGDKKAKWPLNTDAVQNLAFSEDVLTSGVNSQVVNIDDNNAIVVNIVEHHESALEPLDKVHDEVLAMVKKQRLNEDSVNALENLGKALQADPNAKVPDNIKKTANVDVAAGSTNVGPEFNQAIFALPRTIERPYVVDKNNGTTTLAVMTKVNEGVNNEDKSTLTQYENIIGAQYGQYLNLNAQDALYRQARQLSDIEYHQDAIKLVTSQTAAD